MPGAEYQSTMQGTDTARKAVDVVEPRLVAPAGGEMLPEPCAVIPPPQTSPSAPGTASHTIGETWEEQEMTALELRGCAHVVADKMGRYLESRLILKNGKSARSS